MIRSRCLEKAGCGSFVLTRSGSVKTGARLQDNKRFPKAPAQVTDPLKLRTVSVIGFRSRNRAEAEIPKVLHEHITNKEKRSRAGILHKRETTSILQKTIYVIHHRRRK